jgi:hypothetical protein
MVKEMTELEKRLRRMRSNSDRNNPSGMLKFKPEVVKNLAKKPKGNKI